jgi:hypothetical protein
MVRLGVFPTSLAKPRRNGIANGLTLLYAAEVLLKGRVQLALHECASNFFGGASSSGILVRIILPSYSFKQGNELSVPLE